jgi:hypothetical protein
MKLAVFAAAGLLLFSNSGFADPAPGPLPPGKPAGVEKAQGIDTTTAYIIAGLAVVGIIVGVAVSGGDDNSSSGTLSVTPH